MRYWYNQDEESIKIYRKHKNYCTKILKWHKQGLSTKEIAGKLYIAEGFVKDIINKGQDRHLTELAKLLNITNPENTTTEQQTSDYLCTVCNVPLINIEPIEYNGHEIQIMQCKKCNRKYYDPDDVKNALKSSDK